ncbi:MAG: hypothetical protein HYX78_13745 [Armatimonadetes bacterium]|nr:hypothetical protein [Armatimonadota bacterium]
MHKSIWSHFLALCLLTIGSIIPASALTTSKSEPDPRLSQPVTIECANVRLHTVIERLSQMTGVTIRCGRNKDDWKVRDIPVVVYAKDLPLGKLLQAIADATHLKFSSSKIDGVWKYRIWRTARQERELAEYENAKSTAVLAAATYDWDLWTKLKDMPNLESDDSPVYFASSLRDPALVAISNIMADLGTEVRDNVLEGETIRLTLMSAPDSMAERLQVIFDGVWQMFAEAAGSHGRVTDPLTPDELDEANIEIRFSDGTDSPAGIEVEARAGHYSKDYGMYLLSERLRKKGHDIPLRPEIPERPGTEQIDAKYSELHRGGASILPEKVTLEAPKNVARLTAADVLVALAKAIDYTLVSEDFHSHYCAASSSAFGREVSVVALRDEIGWEFLNSWRVNSKNRIILGHDRNWIQRHRNLVPESLIKRLIAKLKAEGFDLDDLEPLACLTPDQCGEWILMCPELQPLRGVSLRFSTNPLWSLYYSLKRSDRVKARSDKGLSLAGQDPRWIREAFRCKKEQLKKMRRGDGSPIPLSEMTKYDSFADPYVLPTLRLRISRDKRKLTDNRWNYYLEIEGVKDGERIRTGDFLPPLPIYPSEREAELKKKQAAGGKKK